ncbi:MAG: hypothetical protein U9N57_10460 [Pseudomonadota bacterium]|nr:hypothetical protein [Pseudomonadota bacterium]
MTTFVTTWVVLGSIVLLLALLVTGRVQAFKAFVALVFFYYLTDLITLDSMLSNFVNPALITLIVLLMVSQVLEKTRLVQWVGQKLFKKSLRTSIARMGLLVGGEYRGGRNVDVHSR